LLSGRYSQNQLNNLDSVSMNSGSQDVSDVGDSYSSWPEKSHQDHKAYRDSVLRKVDDFMDLDFEQYLEGATKRVALESLRGAKPYIKNEVFVTQLLNGCDAAGGSLFESFEREYITEAKANEPPEVHAQWLMKELGLESE
jgi:hypothetical protein